MPVRNCAFSAGETAEMLGISTSFLRKLHFDEKVPNVAASVGGRGRYTGQNIQIIREVLEKSAKIKGTYLRGRRPGDKVQVLSFLNFKGGVGKTTSAIHAAQRLALKGYRVLALDIDPQASLTTLFGYRPEIDFLDSGTIYDAVRYNDPRPFSEIIQKPISRALTLPPAACFCKNSSTKPHKPCAQTSSRRFMHGSQPPCRKLKPITTSSSSAAHRNLVI